MACMTEAFMATRIKRRDFMTTTAGAGIAAAARPLAASSGPAVIVQGSSRPVVVASANGHRFKNGGAQDLRRDSRSRR